MVMYYLSWLMVPAFTTMVNVAINLDIYYHHTMYVYIDNHHENTPWLVTYYDDLLHVHHDFTIKYHTPHSQVYQILQISFINVNIHIAV